AGVLADAAGGELEIADRVFLAGLEVAVGDSGLVDFDAGDVEGDRRTAPALVFLRGFCLGRRLPGLCFEEVAEIEGPVLVLDDVGLEARDADAVDDDLPAQQ